MMIRVLNFFSFALAALCCLALYHLSEETRIARVKLLSVAEPSRIHALARSQLGLADTAAISVASLDLLPRHADAPLLSGSPVQTASMVANVALSDLHIHLAAAHAGN